MTKTQRAQLDELDIAILRHLEQDGRRSYSEIAADLGVAVSTVSARVTKLIEAEVVTILAHVNPYKVGLEAPAVLSISIQPDRYDQVADTILAYPEVTFASMTTGAYNLTVDVYCRGTAHLAELVRDRVHSLQGVQDIEVRYHLKILKLKPIGIDAAMEQDRLASALGGLGKSGQVVHPHLPEE
jgi:Lrp/AsnC family transcriptional regulator for asnA, asnC and gidA